MLGTSRSTAASSWARWLRRFMAGPSQEEAPRISRLRARDPRTSQKAIPLVEDDRLPRRDRALGDVEDEPAAVGIAEVELRWCRTVAIADLGVHPAALPGGVRREPV